METSDGLGWRVRLLGTARGVGVGPMGLACLLPAAGATGQATSLVAGVGVPHRDAARRHQKQMLTTMAASMSRPYGEMLMAVA